MATGPLFELPAGPEGLLSEAAWPSGLADAHDTCVKYCDFASVIFVFIIFHLFSGFMCDGCRK